MEIAHHPADFSGIIYVFIDLRQVARCFELAVNDSPLSAVGTGQSPLHSSVPLVTADIDNGAIKRQGSGLATDLLKETP
jgi:hypothetical protein